MSAARTGAPAAGRVRGFGEQTAANEASSSSASPEGKAFANVGASLALKGYALHRLADGCLVIERWGYSRTVASVTQAARFLAQIGGAV